MQPEFAARSFFEVSGVRFQLAVVGCLLAGCALQPTAAPPHPTALARAVVVPASTADSLPRLVAGLPPPTFAVRIGVEHLPPEAATEVRPRCEVLSMAPAPARRPLREAARPDRARAAAEQPFLAAATEDPLAREALQFVNDMVEADRRRVEREVGLPFFEFQAVDPDRGPLLNSERDLATDHELWLQANGRTLLQRPLRQMLRRLPLVRDLEVEFEDFRADHVPWTEPYAQAHARERMLGRISLRVHASDAHDPVEVAWVHSGLLLGSSQQTGKLGFRLPLSEDLRLELRARTDYATEEFGLRLDLTWRASARTSLHAAVGDDMDFLSTSSLYSLFESPMDGAPGLVVYAAHVF